MTPPVKLVKVRSDGLYVFEREGVYFVLTKENFDQLRTLFEEIENESN